jgi:hypothetical protein
MLSNILIMLRSFHGVRYRQPLQIPKVEIAKVIEGYGFRLATSVTTEEMKGESTAVLHGEALAAIKTLSSNFTSHPGMLCSVLAERE